MKNKHTLIVLIVVFAILLTATIITTTNPSIIGRSIEEQSFEYSENLNQIFLKDGEFIWTPENKGAITSIKISGEINKNSKTKIYFENLLLFDNAKNSKPTFLTGKSIENETEIIEENQTKTNQTEETIIENETEIIEENQTKTNQTEETIIENETEIIEENQTKTNQTEETIIENETEIIEENQTKTNQTEETIIENETEIIEEKEEPKIQEEEKEELNILEEIPEEMESKNEIKIEKINFENICEETCLIKNDIPRENYSIKIQTDSELIITKITYKISEDKPKTISNLTLNNKEEVQKRATIEKTSNFIDTPKIAIIILAIIGIVIAFIKNPKKKTKKKKIRKK